MLEVGSLAPDLELPDQDGQLGNICDLRGRQNVVIFFYPKDNTLVCTLEVCAFRDAHPELVGLDAVVLGISGDGASSHQSFRTKWHLPYRLLTDAEGTARRRYAVHRSFGLFNGRVTYVVDKEGIVRSATSDPLRANHHVREVLRALNAQKVL